MYKALTRILKAVRCDEHLSISLILELNWLVIGSLWKDDDSYFDAKNKGQEEGEIKRSQNLIRISQGNKELLRQEPLSNPDNVSQNMSNLIESIRRTEKDVFERSAFLAQELWLHQPFVEGNKRTGRLLTNFLTMKEGYLLFVYEDKNKNYNSLLIEQYLESQPYLILNYIKKKLNETMLNQIRINKLNDKGKGFRMIL
ncbi:filamentation induced by cAMP protein fic [Galbibacter marinus]|uniref:Filamentation induced by cAMP protein fic n=1 Tax=Galbibacter marinus TaxID=555500 RepID=K2QIS2_9FLAO|nr:Fic family protein [Galbibacter marinus]EKF54612.1 filamentation induced by cAMP protein fic [Galbibacter marinus]